MIYTFEAIVCSDCNLIAFLLCNCSLQLSKPEQKWFSNNLCLEQNLPLQYWQSPTILNGAEQQPFKEHLFDFLPDFLLIFGVIVVWNGEEGADDGDWREDSEFIEFKSKSSKTTADPSSIEFGVAATAPEFASVVDKDDEDWCGCIFGEGLFCKSWKFLFSFGFEFEILLFSLISKEGFILIDVLMDLILYDLCNLYGLYDL